MTYGEMFKRCLYTIRNEKVEDYRPNEKMYTEDLDGRAGIRLWFNAEKAKIDAEAKAEATRIKAEAEAEANKKIAESLTPELIEQKKIEKWNGDVPTVSGSSATIVDIGGV